MDEIISKNSNEFDFIDTQDLEELTYFENFLNRMGFKRIDGSIYGLLVLASRPLTSEEIESTLKLSQSAVSISLKNLTHYGAVETADFPENKRVKIHWAKEDSLSIVSTIFRKREAQYVEEFKFMAQRLYKKAQEKDQVKRMKKLRSIILTCESAEAVMNFVIGLTRLQVGEHYESILNKLPKSLESLARSAEGLNDLSTVKDGLGARFEKIRQTLIK